MAKSLSEKECRSILEAFDELKIPNIQVIRGEYVKDKIYLGYDHILGYKVTTYNGLLFVDETGNLISGYTFYPEYEAC